MSLSAAARNAARASASALVIGAVAAVPAQANVTALDASIAYTDASRSTCEKPAYAWPYKAIGDSRTYVLAPHGAFTGAVAPGWQLRNGARFVGDGARGVGLALPPGASAISPGMCVDLDYPHFRFAHKVVGRNAGGVEINVEVTYPQLKRPVWTEVKQFDGYQGNVVASGWRISPDVDLKPDFGGSVAGARYVALRFTAVKKSSTSAEFRVDDVYIDPRMRR
jgi:hypothetical protein